MNGGRKRHRRTGRYAVLLLVVAAGAVLWTWPRSGDWARRMLTGRRAAQDKPLALQPVAPPENGASEHLSSEGKPEAKAAPTIAPPSTSETQPSRLPPSGDPTPAAPVTDRTDLTDQPLVRLASPTTQPAPSVSQAGFADRTGAEYFATGLTLLRDDNLLQARDALNRALQAGLPASQGHQAQGKLRELADRLLFSKAVLADDPLVTRHVVTSGDTVGRLAHRAKISEYLLADVNDLPNRNFIREGQTLKLLNGPFHATINKSTHEMHVYLQDTYVRTFRVALGEDGSTPKGLWRVINKLENPGWTDPRTGKHWHPDDPENPIGDYWIGLECVEGGCLGMVGYGIHGTIEPETIGQNVSMGCVRLGDKDIDWVYKMLTIGESLVRIHD